MTKILIIEDNTVVRENIAEILELSGFEVFMAEHGKQGVRMAIDHIPDLIICDVMMPELDGYGVLHLLKKNIKTENIPFIFLTAKAERLDFRKGMNLGADDYITKPFDDLELLDAIDIRLKKYKRQQKIKVEEGSFVQTDIGEKSLLALVEDQEIRIYNKKDSIYREGEYPRQVFYIKKGKIKTCKTHEDGKELIVSLQREGDFLGFLPLINSTKYTETSVALEKAELCIIPQKDFLTLLKSNNAAAAYIMQHLARNLVEKKEQLVDLAYNSVRKRVADALLLLQDRYKENGEEYVQIAILREDLASLVGTAKETVIRTLSDFKQEGIISIKGRIIVITNEVALHQMLN